MEQYLHLCFFRCRRVLPGCVVEQNIHFAVIEFHRSQFKELISKTVFRRNTYIKQTYMPFNLRVTDEIFCIDIRIGKKQFIQSNLSLEQGKDTNTQA